jgi:hypothetical protein
VNITLKYARGKRSGKYMAATQYKHSSKYFTSPGKSVQRINEASFLQKVANFIMVLSLSYMFPVLKEMVPLLK